MSLRKISQYTLYHSIVLATGFLICMLPASAQRGKRNAEGILKGIVVDARAGRPISDADVAADYIGDATDRKGRFTIEYQTPGMRSISAGRRDYLESAQQVRVRAGRVTYVKFRLRRQPRAVCKLAGNWSVHFTLKKAAGFGSSPTRHNTSGTIIFRPSTPPFLPRKVVFSKDPTLDEFGSFAVDFRPFWGKQFDAGGSTSFFGGKGGQSFLTEASGYIFAGNEVTIHLIPRVSHGGLYLTGRVKGDTITGNWDRLTYAGNGGRGEFSMHRVKNPGKETRYSLRK